MPLVAASILQQLQQAPLQAVEQPKPSPLPGLPALMPAWLGSSSMAAPVPTFNWQPNQPAAVAPLASTSLASMRSMPPLASLPWLQTPAAPTPQLHHHPQVLLQQPPPVQPQALGLGALMGTKQLPTVLPSVQHLPSKVLEADSYALLESSISDGLAKEIREYNNWSTAQLRLDRAANYSGVQYETWNKEHKGLLQYLGFLVNAKLCTAGEASLLLYADADKLTHFIAFLKHRWVPFSWMPWQLYCNACCRWHDHHEVGTAPPLHQSAC